MSEQFYSIRDSRRSDCGRLARSVCAERWLAYREGGVDVHRQIVELFANSPSLRRTCLIGERPVAMWGVVGTLLSFQGHVWVVLSREAASYPRKVISEVRRQLQEIVSSKREIRTSVALQDTVALRFAELLGFVKDGEPMQVQGFDVSLQPMLLKEKAPATAFGYRFQTEDSENVYAEAQPLLDLHWEEIAKNKQLLTLNPDRDYYRRQHNSFLLVTCRHRRELVGYFLWNMGKHPHYKHVMTAQEDIHFLRQDHRKGLTGYLLMKNARDEAMHAGAHLLIMREKIGHEHPPLMARLGFTPADIVYTMAVGG